MGTVDMSTMQAEIAEIQYQLHHHHDEVQKLSYRLEALTYTSNGFVKYSADDIKKMLDRGAVLEIPGSSIYILKYNGEYTQVSVFCNATQIYIRNNYSVTDAYAKEASNPDIIKFLASIRTLDL